MNHSAAREPTRPGGYLFGDDYVDHAFDAPKQLDEEAIRREAHVVNGGEQRFECPACKGRGRFISYAGRDIGPCFKCKGKKTVSRGVAAAAKGKATKLANQAKWHEDNADAVAYARKRADKGSSFYASLLEKLDAYGTWTEGQLALIERDRAKDAAFYEARNAEREANRPVIASEAIQKLFDTAVENDVKKPIFRTVDITINKAPMSGKNPGALYVKTTNGGEYCGMIKDGKWVAKWGAPDVLEALKLVAENPGEEAIRYANKFSRCGICGTATIDPVSVRSAVGPICARKWGLEHLREAARASLKEGKENE